MNIFLQIFLYADVFIIGAVSATAIRHAYAHFRPHPAEKNEPPQSKQPSLTKEVRDKLILDAEAKYQGILDRSAEQLNKELTITSEKISAGIKQLAADMAAQEQKAYAEVIKQYQQQAATGLASAKDETAAYQNDLKAKMEAAAEEERQRLISLIDNKLSDAVLSFLIEAMQHEVDLGAQADYLMKLLDKHKDEFKQAIS
jgi:flagellar biosynthesis/type III secretory pathway protein FliH